MSSAPYRGELVLGETYSGALVGRTAPPKFVGQLLRSQQEKPRHQRAGSRSPGKRLSTPGGAGRAGEMDATISPSPDPSPRRHSPLRPASAVSVGGESSRRPPVARSNEAVSLSY
jgi:hypothetical protein